MMYYYIGVNYPDQFGKVVLPVVTSNVGISVIASLPGSEIKCCGTYI